MDHVPGIIIPEEGLARMAGAGEGREREEGLMITLDLLKEILPVLKGVHIMPTGDFKVALEIVEQIGSRS
jgi:5,10-methylenetetrahydrofolate reductase